MNTIIWIDPRTSLLLELLWGPGVSMLGRGHRIRWWWKVKGYLSALCPWLCGREDSVLALQTHWFCDEHVRYPDLSHFTIVWHCCIRLIFLSPCPTWFTDSEQKCYLSPIQKTCYFILLAHGISVFLSRRTDETYLLESFSCGVVLNSSQARYI